MEKNTQRLHYFDMMKGVAIFLVVMGHVITMCVREIDRAPIFKFIELIHMPLFFFISGWFAYKTGEKGVIRIRSLEGKVLRLLLPMIATSTLWIFYFPHSGLQSPLDSTFEGLWSNTWKNGYWFTLVLFEIFIIHTAITPLLSKCKTAVLSAIMVLGVWAVLIEAFFIIPQEITYWISLELLVSFFPAFMFGVLARRYREGFCRAVHTSGFQTVNLIILGVLFYVCPWSWELELTYFQETVLQALLHISLAFIAFAVFQKWSGHAFSSEASQVSKGAAGIWIYIGKKSLGIYLLHYFFLFPMGDLFRETLLSVNLSFVPLLVFSVFWAAIIVAVVLGIIKLIEPSKILSLLLTGQTR